MAPQGSGGGGGGGGGGGEDLRGLLDAAITGWNKRDKKIPGHAMTCIDPKSFPFEGGKKMFVPIYEQSAYKYLVYIDGHCAACRYAFMMRLGSVILKVESRCVADRMWYFPLLKPWVDHVPVAADLSDLKDKILWCRAHDAECRAIAENAKRLYDRFVSKEGVLDYLELLCHEIAQRTEHPPQWWTPAKPPQPPPSAAPQQQHHQHPPGSHTPAFAVGQLVCDGEGYCARCAAEISAHREAQAKKRAQDEAAKRQRGGAAAAGPTKRKQGEGYGGGGAPLPEMTRPVPAKKRQNKLGKQRKAAGAEN